MLVYGGSVRIVPHLYLKIVTKVTYFYGLPREVQFVDIGGVVWSAIE